MLCVLTWRAPNHQTGSGKTYTMLGPLESVLRVDRSTGLIPRVVQHLFERIGAAGAEHQSLGRDCSFVVRCSYLEIYNETIQDLLAPGSTALQASSRELLARVPAVSPAHELPTAAPDS